MYIFYGQDHSIKNYVPFKNPFLKTLNTEDNIHVLRCFYSIYLLTHTSLAIANAYCRAQYCI